MDKKILLLGYTGKMGIALNKVFKDDYVVVCKNSKNFDAGSVKRVKEVIMREEADIVINTVAFMGIDQGHQDPFKAMSINALYPKLLAELSQKIGYVLIHFSSESVFDNQKRGYYVESDQPRPMSVYGLTKYGADCFIQSTADNYYIFRLPILFGATKKQNQFIEKMLERVREGETSFRIADDIVSSPSYSLDIAREVRRIVELQLPYGLYHLANKGKGSLFELFREIAETCGFDINLEKVSYKAFKSVGIKNTYTPMKSEKIDCLRSWKEAVREYVQHLIADLSKEDENKRQI